MDERKSKTYHEILLLVKGLIDDYWSRTGKKPNKIFMSGDIFSFIRSYDLLTFKNIESQEEKLYLMGMELELNVFKRGYVEVGYMEELPYKLNLEHDPEGEV